MSSQDQSDRPLPREPVSLLGVLKAYLAIMRPYLISVVGLGLAFGCWQADNWPGTIFFLGLAVLPVTLRLLFRAVAWLRRGGSG